MHIERSLFFDEVSLIDEGSPGPFDSFSSTGQWNTVAVGPRTLSIPHPGFSGDLHSLADRASDGPSYGVWNLSADTKTTGMIIVWYRFKTLDSVTPAGHYNRLLEILNSAQTVTELSLAIRNGNLWVGRSGFNDYEISPVIALETYTWYCFAMAWKDNGDNTFDHQVYMKLQDEDSFTLIDSQANSTKTASDFTYIRVGNWGANSTYHSRGRIGGIVLYHLDVEVFPDDIDFVEMLSPLDLIDPPTTRPSWYIDTSTGSDSNTGLSGSPWQTLEKLNNELKYSGILGYMGTYASGDAIYITSTTDSPLTFGDFGPLMTKTNGIEILPANGYTQIHFKPTFDLTSWTHTSGNVYETDNTEAGAVVWENDKWLNPLSSNDYGSNEELIAACDSTVGSYIATADIIYLHPFNSTDPSSDGKHYERTNTFGSVDPSAIVINSEDVHLKGVVIDKTIYKRDTDGEIFTGGYGIIVKPGADGDILVEDCDISYYGAHACGFVADGTHSNVTFRNIIATQGPPDEYHSGSTFNPFVSFSNAGSGIVNTWDNCVYRYNNVGDIGSSVGITNVEQNAILIHGAGNFDTIYIQNCRMDSGFIAQNDDIVTNGMQITNSVFATASIVRGLVSRCVSHGTISGRDDVTVEHSKIQGSYAPTVINRQIYGDFTVRFCSIDRREEGSNSLWLRVEPLNLTFQNNVFVGDGTLSGLVEDGVEAEDTYTFDYNYYYLSSSGESAKIMDDWNSEGNTLSFDEWQGLGHDLNSTETNDATVITDGWSNGLALLPRSVLIGAASGTTNEIDFTGRTFATRDDIGAYEFLNRGHYIDLGMALGIDP